jgi:ribosomal protein S18 acetylase RimI-like enzyme
MLAQLQQYLRASASRGRATARVGPFLITISESTDHPFLNYAIPDDGARPGPDEVRALVAAFAARGRVPRLEYLEPSAPASLAALVAGGFAVEGRLQAMTAARASDVAAPAGYALAVPDTDEDLTAMLDVQQAAYGQLGMTGAEQLAASRKSQAAGAIVLAIRHDTTATIVGGGIATPPDGSGFTEIAGIAVADEHRRRGLATALAAGLTRRALVAGVRTAFLTPADDDVARVYERAGFERIGRMLHLRHG